MSSNVGHYLIICYLVSVSYIQYYEYTEIVNRHVQRNMQCYVMNVPLMILRISVLECRMQICKPISDFLFGHTVVLQVCYSKFIVATCTNLDAKYS